MLALFLSLVTTICFPGCCLSSTSSRVTTLSINPLLTPCNSTADCTAEHGMWAICEEEHCICSNGTTFHEKTCLSKGDEALLHIFGFEVYLSFLLIILGVIFCLLIPLALYILCTCNYCWKMIGEEVRTEEKEAEARRSEELMLRIASTKTFVVSQPSSKSLFQPPSQEKVVGVAGGGGKSTAAVAAAQKIKGQIKVATY